MGQPVVHFEICGPDADALRAYYADLFGWTYDTNNPMGYGLVERNTNPDGIGIGGGVAGVPEGYAGHLTFYVEVPDVAASLKQAESLGGKPVMGPEHIQEGLVVGQFVDPQGHLVGLIQGAS